MSSYRAVGVHDALRRVFTYAEGESRATGYLYVEGEQAWPPSFAQRGDQLLDELEQFLGVRFTIVAFQAYLDGNAWTDWHTDDAFDAQAILSLGATRTFGIDGEEIQVNAGDLYYLPSGCHLPHSIRPDPHVTEERCSLVFRTVLGEPCTSS